MEEYIKENNLDEIDAFLMKEFGIMGGCCASQKELEYNVARQVAEKLWKKEELVSEDLEEAAKNHAAERYRTTRDEFLAKKCKWSFVAGAKWDKKQMIKDAVEIPLHQWLPAMLYDKMSEKGFKDGDKVKLIILEKN